MRPALQTEPVVQSPPRTITVLHSLAAPDGTTKYVNQIAESAPNEVAVQYFSWRFALRGDYDVLHLHWPEMLLRGRTARLRFAKRIAMRLVLARIALRRVPLVRTVHNMHPHEAGTRPERALLQRVDAGTDLFIGLNPTTTAPGAAPLRTILHGHYRDRFAGHSRSTPVDGRLLYFGLIRPYKGVDRLVQLAPGLAAQDVTVRIVGNPSTDMRVLVESAEARIPSLSAVLAFVPDAQLVREVTAATLVALPYRELHNSGVVLVALSLDTPVLVPRSPSTTALAAEVGPGWVTLYDGELDEATVVSAMAAARDRPTARPQLEGRDWSTVGVHHLDAYRTALAAKRAGRGRI